MPHPIIFSYANGGNLPKRVSMPFGKRSKRSETPGVSLAGTPPPWPAFVTAEVNGADGAAMTNVANVVAGTAEMANPGPPRPWQPGPPGRAAGQGAKVTSGPLLGTKVTFGPLGQGRTAGDCQPAGVDGTASQRGPPGLPTGQGH